MAGKKRKEPPTLQELLEKPWCYYCDRTFADDVLLNDHQRVKHFKCPTCHKRLNSCDGMRTHSEHVHKKKIEKVENALPHREGDIFVEIVGTTGVPPDALEAHNQKVTQEYFRMQYESGNVNGQGNGNAVKAQKRETSEERKAEKIGMMETTEERKARVQKRIAEVKAQREAKARGEVVEDVKSPQIKVEDTKQQTKSETPSSDITSPAFANPMPQSPTRANLPVAGWSAARGSELPPSLRANSPSQQYPFHQDARNPYHTQTSHEPVVNGATLSYATQDSDMQPQPAIPTYPARVEGHVPAQFERLAQNYHRRVSTPQTANPLPPPPYQQSSLKSSSSLPPRPNFDVADLTKEDMARMHFGEQLPMPGVQMRMPAAARNDQSSNPYGFNQQAVHDPNQSTPGVNGFGQQAVHDPTQSTPGPKQLYGAYGPSNAGMWPQESRLSQSEEFNSALDELIEQGKIDAHAKHVSAGNGVKRESTGGMANEAEPEPAPAPSNRKKTTNTKLVLSDNVVSPEEKRARTSGKYTHGK